jgi:hypothetical protein
MSKIKLMTALGLLFIVGNSCAKSRSAAASIASLQKEEKDQAVRDQIDAQPVAEIISSSKPDRFTQTQAHLFLKSMRDLIAKKYPDTEEHLDVVSAVVANEGEHKDTHYAFYHTTSNTWRLAQDLYTRLYAYEHPDQTVNRDFKFLRYNDESTSATSQGFLVNELKEKGLVDDNSNTAAIMISVNFALFGNVGFPGECSWHYFIYPQSHKAPKRETYESMLTRFGFSHKYIDRILALADIYDTKEDTLMQILVPIDKVDQIGYVAWVRGIPAHGGVMKEVLDQTKGYKGFETKESKRTGKTKVGTKETLASLTDQFAGNKNDPLFKDMLEQVEKGEYSLNKFLKVYRNKPYKEMNDVTGRLLFTPDVLLNPSSGVKFFRFSTVSKEKLSEYNKKLNALITEMTQDKEAGLGAQSSTAQAPATVKPAQKTSVATKPTSQVRKAVTAGGKR